MSSTKPIKKSITIFPYRGKWRIQFFDSDGNLRTKAVNSKEDAYKYLHIAEQLIATGKLPLRPTDIPYFEDWIWQWFESRRNEVRPITLVGFESTIRLHLLPGLRNSRLDKISTMTLENLFKSLMVEKRLSASSVHKIQALLSHSFSLAMRFGYVSSNPARNVKLPKITRERQQVLSAEQISVLLEEASELGLRSHLRWVLALRYGLRQGECLALIWSDFDLENQVLSITKTVKHHSGAGFLITEPKSQNSVRTLPLDRETLTLAIKAKSDATTDSLVFPDSNGSYTSAKTDYCSWRKLLKACNIPQLKLHAARHSAATSLLAAGVDIRTIQLILGHSTPAFTMATYLHPNQDQMLKAFEKVGQKLDK